MHHPSSNDERLHRPRRLINARLAAERTAYSESRFRVLAPAGVLPAPIQLGPRKIMWDVDVLDRYIADRAALSRQRGAQRAAPLH